MSIESIVLIFIIGIMFGMFIMYMYVRQMLITEIRKEQRNVCKNSIR